jgi:hypothetical protein
MSYRDMKTSDLIRSLVSCGVIKEIPDPKLVEEIDRRLPVPERVFCGSQDVRIVTVELQTYADSDAEARKNVHEFLSIGFHKVLPPNIRFDHWRIVKTE